jgi:hypothetical protein
MSGRGGRIGRAAKAATAGLLGLLLAAPPPATADDDERRGRGDGIRGERHRGEKDRDERGRDAHRGRGDRDQRRDERSWRADRGRGEGARPAPPPRLAHERRTQEPRGDDRRWREVRREHRDHRDDRDGRERWDRDEHRDWRDDGRAWHGHRHESRKWRAARHDDRWHWHDGRWCPPGHRRPPGLRVGWYAARDDWRWARYRRPTVVHSPYYCAACSHWYGERIDFDRHVYGYHGLPQRSFQDAVAQLVWGLVYFGP